MSNTHAELVRLTALFIEKYGSIISQNKPDSEMKYGYNTSGSSNVSFHLNDETCYIFEIIPHTSTIKIQLATLKTPEQPIYRDFLKAAPFITIEYKRVFEIFDFIKTDDEQLGSIQSFKRFNAISDSCHDFFNTNKLIYEIGYKDFYKKINRRVKMNTVIGKHLGFDTDMNIIVNYNIDIIFSDRDVIAIKFNNVDDHYSVDDHYMNKEQLLNYISVKRRRAIRKNINRSFKNIDFDIDFDNKYQEQIQLLEMLTI